MSRSMLSMALSTALLMALPGTEPGANGSPPVLSATVEQCVTAATQAARSVTFTGQMETVPGTHRMAIEIVVQERAGEEADFHTLTAAGLSTSWQRSEAGVKIYKVRQAVTDLPAPAVFRALVRYRWLNERGQVLRHDLRRTPTCRQPSPSQLPATRAPADKPPATRAPARRAAGR